MTAVSAKYFFITHLAAVLALHSACHAIDECATSWSHRVCVWGNQDNVRMLERSNHLLLIAYSRWRKRNDVIQGGFRLCRVDQDTTIDAAAPFVNPVRLNLRSVISILDQRQKVIPNCLKPDRQNDLVFFGPTFPQQTLPGCLPNVLQASMFRSHAYIEWQPAGVAEGIDIVVWVAIESESMCDSLANDRYQRLLLEWNRKSLKTVSTDTNATATVRAVPRRACDPVPAWAGKIVFAMRAVHLN